MTNFMGESMMVPYTAALAAAIVATVTDIRTLRIHNVLTVPVCLSGLLFHGMQSGWEGLIASLAGVGIGFAVLILPYLMGILGAGDVKLLMGMGAWIGGHSTALVALFGCLATGVVAVVILARRDGFSAVRVNAHLSLLRLQTIRRHLFSTSDGTDIKSMAADPKKRQNLIPFSIMLTMGLVTLLVIAFTVGPI